MDENITYTRTDEMKRKIDVVSQMIRALNITNEENDNLVAALTELQCDTEKSMFLQGIEAALNFIGVIETTDGEFAN